MSIKISFSIKDLENLSGVKAHTIRAWEKRYNLLQPQRTDSNIRTYDEKNLKKLLNISLLNQNGCKISKIALFSEHEIIENVKELSESNSNCNPTIVDLKLAMMQFNESLLEATYQKLMLEKSFCEIFQDEFIPLLKEVGNLWVTGTICPAQERFVSTFIRHKILINIENLSVEKINDDRVFALYLPLNEMHDIGILYIHYRLLKCGYKSLYLGAGVPLSDLSIVQKNFNNIHFVSYFTVEPSLSVVYQYLEEISKNVLEVKNEKLYIFGPLSKEINKINTFKNIFVFNSLTDFKKYILN